MSPTTLNLSTLDGITWPAVLPSSNGLVCELKRLLSDEESTIEQLGGALALDPSLSARLICLVNSPLAGAPRTIVSLETSVRLLGRYIIANLVDESLPVGSDRVGYSKQFDFDRYWSESIARAIAARTLAHHFACISPEESYTLALLSRIGTLALAMAYPDPYDALLREVGDGEPSVLMAAERRHFGWDHNAVTATLLSSWHLTEMFRDAVSMQDRIDAETSQGDSRVVRIARMLRFVGSLASVLIDGEFERGAIDALATDAARCGIPPERFSAEFAAIKQEWSSVQTLLDDGHLTTSGAASVAALELTEKKKLLIVDDDDFAMGVLKKALSSADYEILTASNGVEALRIIHRHGCQMVISDWMMPEMNGLELCRAIRDSEGSGFVYVILLTAQHDPHLLAEAFDAGVDDYIAKPCKKEELLARLKAGERTIALEQDLAKQRRTLHKANAEMAILNQKFHKMATTDELTGLPNRREAMSRLHEMWALSLRHDRPFSCMAIDIDHFKRCNDDYGHDVGDIVLRETARLLKSAARTGESVFRVGGEEFLVLCPGATAQEAARGAERLRLAVESHRGSDADNRPGVTISVGVAERDETTDQTEAFLKRADEALYEAKDHGRNIVCIAALPSERSEPEPRPRTPALGASESTSARGRVLVVDDDTDIRQLFTMFLQKAGFEVHQAADGREALTMTSKIHPDAILMDVQMPNMDGLECTRRLKSNPECQDIPIIIVSGHNDKDGIMAGLEAGAEEYIAKPVKHDELVLRVQAMTNLHRSNAALLQSNRVRGEQARAMALLFDLSRSLAVAGTIAEVLEPVVTATAELTMCRRVSILLPDDTGEHLHIAHSIGLNPELTPKICIPFGHDIAGRVFSSGEATVLNSEDASHPLSERYDSVLFASVPLASHAMSVSDHVVGVLNTTERQGRQPFEAQELEYLDLICNMAASSIEQIQSHRANERAYASIVVGLAKLAEYRDVDTGNHLERVTRYARTLAEALRVKEPFAADIDDQFLDDLDRAMPLHDIGKVAIPDSILLKPAKLTDEEFEIMKRHAQIGADALDAVLEKAPEASFLKTAKEVAHAHHEWVDGTGYPRGLSGDAIPLSARIATVADVYDALTTERPYKDAFSHEKAVEIITRSSGSQFDPAIVEAFISLSEAFENMAAELHDSVKRHLVASGGSEPVACLAAGTR